MFIKSPGDKDSAAVNAVKPEPDVISKLPVIIAVPVKGNDPPVPPGAQEADTANDEVRAYELLKA
jgi:hypothetical protein